MVSLFEYLIHFSEPVLLFLMYKMIPETTIISAATMFNWWSSPECLNYSPVVKKKKKKKRTWQQGFKTRPLRLALMKQAISLL